MRQQEFIFGSIALPKKRWATFKLNTTQSIWIEHNYIHVTGNLAAIIIGNTSYYGNNSFTFHLKTIYQKSMVL